MTGTEKNVEIAKLEKEYDSYLAETINSQATIEFEFNYLDTKFLYLFYDGFVYTEKGFIYSYNPIEGMIKRANNDTIVLFENHVNISYTEKQAFEKFVKYVISNI